MFIKGTTKIGYKVALRFKIVQSLRDLLLEKFKFFRLRRCVYVKKAARFIVSKFSDNFSNVIPFFNKIFYSKS